MRRLFLALLAANLLYAGWALLSPREDAPGSGRREEAPAYPAKLELASEYSPAGGREAAGPAGTPSAVPGAEAAGLAAAEASVLPADAGADAGPAVAPVAALGVAGGVPASELEAAGGAPADAVVAGPGEAATEAAAAQPAASTAAAAPRTEGVAALAQGAAQGPADAVAPTRLCVRIGPLRDAVAGERLRQRVREWLPETRLAEGDTPDRSSYWVHVPPRASDDEARAVVRTLQAQGIDSFVIRDEPALRHGVSLGVFRDAESARESRERLQGIGYPVAIHEKPRTRRALFLLGAADAGAGPAVPPALAEAVAATAPGAGVEPAGCDGIAPPPASD